MEETLAILMADLSGYTALTETHGATQAADLIDKYIRIAKDCLTLECHLHERIGDQVIIISPSPDSLLATAIKIITVTSKEEHFLQVHGGLHYGKLLRRNKSLFGAVINFTARIAAKADAGSLWCSREFAVAIENKTETIFKLMGNFKFKNITGEKEIFKISVATEKPAIVDPVCNMVLLDLEAAIQHPDEKSQYFCSPFCLDQYDLNK